MGTLTYANHRSNSMVVLATSISTLILICTISQTEGASENVRGQDNSIQLRRWHTNTGFHRELFTAIQMVAQPKNSYKGCMFLLIETLPSGMYVDMDQLHELTQWGGPQVLSQYPIDVEKPQYLSSSHTIYVFTRTNMEDELVQASVTIPIHLRYHRPSERGPQAEVILRRPRVLSRCPDASLSLGVDVMAPCDHRNSSMCSWVDLQYEIKEGALQAFTVPVGIKAHSTVVVLGTVSISMIGTLSILYSMYKYPEEMTK